MKFSTGQGQILQTDYYQNEWIRFTLNRRKCLCFRQKMTTYALIEFLLILDQIEVSIDVIASKSSKTDHQNRWAWHID
jgi:hypothetical protein